MSYPRVGDKGNLNVLFTLVLVIGIIFAWAPSARADGTAGTVSDGTFATQTTYSWEKELSRRSADPSVSNPSKAKAPSGKHSSQVNGKVGQRNRRPVPDFFIESTRAETQTGYSCTTGAAGTNCNSSRNACQVGTDYNINSNGDVLATPSSRSAQGGSQDKVTLEINRVDSADGSRELLGYDCRAPGTATPPTGAGARTGTGALAADAPAPIVITVSLSDFADMPIKPLAAHAGPTDGWLPVNMPNVLYTDTKAQELDVELLDTPVAIRATPTSYAWDLGDGNTISTDNPGKPYPSEVVSSTYSAEGWYDITLTTTFTGQFAVNGGPWQDIDGSIEVASEPVPIYSKSLESRLVDGDVPVDDGEDPWIPERTSDTEGAQDPHATHRTV